MHLDAEPRQQLQGDVRCRAWRSARPPLQCDGWSWVATSGSAMSSAVRNWLDTSPRTRMGWFSCQCGQTPGCARCAAEGSLDCPGSRSGSPVGAGHRPGRRIGRSCMRGMPEQFKLATQQRQRSGQWAHGGACIAQEQAAGRHGQRSAQPGNAHRAAWILRLRNQSGASRPA